MTTNSSEENSSCEKCGYKSKSNKLKFNETLCEFCLHFAPDKEDLFSKYLSEKTNWRDLQTYRKQMNLPSTRQKSGMISKAEKGFVMSRAPFGYKIEKNDLIKNPDNFKIVEDIFLDFRDSNSSLNTISKKYGFSVNGLKKILRNFTYLGKVKFNGEVHNAPHEPIISSTLFNQVQDKLERLGIKPN